MRRKKNILVFLLGVTLVTTVWLISTSFNFRSPKNEYKQGSNDVFTMSNDRNHPANKLRPDTIGNEGKNNDDLVFEPNKEEKHSNGIKIGEEDISETLKNREKVQDQNENTNNEVRVDVEKPVPDDKDDNNYDDDDLIDVIQFNEDNEWENDVKACRLSDQKKFIQAAMHTTKGDVKIYIHDPEDDIHVSASLKENGEWEPHLIRLIYSLLEKDEKLEFIDLGANIGVFSLAVAKFDRKVIAVEPLSINVRRLCRSIVENEFEDSITVIHNAVSDKHEKVRLGKEKGNVGGSFVAKDENVNKIEGSSVVGQYSDEINTVKLDDLLTLRGIDLDKVIIKMDVEGWERHVLNSAERFFRKVDVQGVLMEWMWHKTGTDANDIISFFINHGYEPVNPNGFQVLDVRTQSSWPTDIFWRRGTSHGHTHGAGQKVPTQSTKTEVTTGVKMYRRDMTRWNLDDTMCRKPESFMVASLHTPAGDVNINVHNPSVDVHVSGSLLRDGAWEPHLIQLMFSLLQNNPSAQFIDLGANLGVFSLAVAKFGRRVLAVEPLSINLQRFCKSIRDNNFQDRITVVTNALGNERETVSFGMDVGNVGGTFVLNNKNLEKQSGSAYGGKYQDKVLTAKVDDFLEIPGFNFKNVVIKMDVEGYEHYVLQGASEFFSKVDVQAVLMEWMWHKAGSGSNQIFTFYSARGYEPFDPLKRVVLDVSNSQNWPIDVLWRKKSTTQAPPQEVEKKPVETSAKMYRHDSNGWVKDTSMCIEPSSLMKANMHTRAGELTIYVHDPAVDIHVSGSLVRSGSWEDNLINIMYSLLSKDSELQFIDLGANLGVYSLAVAKYGRRVLAAEPLSINLQRFCASITANRFENLITVVTNALSDKREKVSFGKDQGNVGGTFVLNDKNMNKFNGSPVNGKYDDVVMSTFLDDVLELPGFNFKKAVMKMDVEGYEHHVLRAAENFFRTVDVQAILMEWMWQKDGSSAQEIIKFFTRHNYEPTSPGSDSVLDTNSAGGWPVDVLWRRKASGKPSFRKNTEQRRQDISPDRQGNNRPRETTRHSQPPRESKREVDKDRQMRIDDRNREQVARQRATNERNNEEKRVQKNSAYDHSNQVSHRSQYGVHFFRRERETWVEDDSSCSTREDFLKSNLHTPAGDVTIYIHDPSIDIHVSGMLQRDETWEPHLISKMINLLSEDPKLQFIDLGANLGVFSLAVAKFGRRVLAAEPLSINLQRFCKSIITNNLQEKITVVTNALSDRIENVSFGKDKGNVGGTFVLNNKNMAKYSGSNIGGRYDDVVQTAKIDSFLELPGFEIKKAIMKIDIEGYEHFAFRAASKFFREVDIQAVLMEWMWHKSGSESGEIVKFFMDRNYEPIDPNTNSKLDVDMSTVWPVDVLWRKMAKSSERYTAAKVPSSFRSGVQVYTHDMRQWVEDDSVCKNLPPMTKGRITNPMPGPYTIYVYEPSVDQYVSGGILQQGGWETSLVNVVLSFLQKDADLQFVDLGANLGVYTLAVAKIGREAIAVDPLTSNVQRMCHSIIDNGFGSKIKLVYNALSDKRGTVSLGKDEKNVGGTFVMDRSNANKVEGSNVNGKIGQDVVTAKLDDLLNLPGFNFRKIIMKMDVEGYEGYVLNGGKKFFDLVDVQAVFMEWMWLKSGSVTQDVLSFFTSRGYKPYLTTSQTELSIQDATSWPVDMMWKKR